MIVERVFCATGLSCGNPIVLDAGDPYASSSGSGFEFFTLSTGTGPLFIASPLFSDSLGTAHVVDVDTGMYWEDYVDVCPDLPTFSKHAW